MLLMVEQDFACDIFIAQLCNRCLSVPAADGEPFGSSCTPRSSLSKVGPTYSQRLNTRGHEQQSIQYCTRSRLSSCGSSIGTLCSSRAIEGATGGKCWCQVSITMQHAPKSTYALPQMKSSMRRFTVSISCYGSISQLHSTSSDSSSICRRVSTT